MTQTEALKLALDALELPSMKTQSMLEQRDAAITAIKEVLTQPDPYAKGYADAMNWKTANHLEHLPAAQPEQKPVAFLTNHRQRRNVQIKPEAFVWMPTTTDWEVPLYTTPPQRTWVGLTDDEIAEIENGYVVDYRIPAGCGWNFAKDIEAKLKEKNT